MKKINFLLVMPRLVTTVGTSYSFPVGIAYISSVLKEAEFSVYTLNLNHIEGNANDILIDEVKRNSIDVVMTGGFSTQYSCLKSIVDCIHKNFSYIKIVVGGVIITADPEVAMTALENADIGIIGEGEITVVELCRSLQEGADDISSIDGIIIKINNEWVITNGREAVDDLDLLPFPDYDGFGIDKYFKLSPEAHNQAPADGETAFPIMSSRSCPFSCTFCFNPNKKFRQRSTANMQKEIEMLVQKYKVKHFILHGPTFAKNKEGAKIRAKEMGKLSKLLDITWAANLNVEQVDSELIEILKHGNCSSVFLGLESADDKILKSMRKGINVTQIDNVMKMAYDAGVSARGNFILGDVEETLETAKNTLDYWENHKNYSLHMGFIILWPGSQLYKYAVQCGRIKDPVQYLKDGGGACINISKLNDDELSYVARRMLSLTESHGAYIIDCTAMNLETAGIGIVSLKGKCAACGAENTWENKKIFISEGRAFCSCCKHVNLLPFPNELKEVFIKNISGMCEKGMQIGLWGINRFTLGFFESNNIFAGENIVFIDSSEQKQMIKIHGKHVYAPEILISKKISNVIFFYPNLYNDYIKIVESNYQYVERFINVYDLFKIS